MVFGLGDDRFDLDVDAVDLESGGLGQRGGDVALHRGADLRQWPWPGDGDRQVGPDAGRTDLDACPRQGATGQLAEPRRVWLDARVSRAAFTATR